MRKVPVPDKQSPVSVWSEKEVVDDELVDALVVVLRGRGCFWASTNGCLMCGYSCDTISSITDFDLMTQFDSALALHKGEQFIKIYTSGSFFDENEISQETRKDILTKAGEKAKQVLVESRPEFVSADAVQDAKGMVNELEVAIGLESASDEIRKRCINKGFSYSDYLKAVETLRKHDARIRTYILLKPPFLTERQAVDDVLLTASAVDECSDVISINPLNVQRGTYVEQLWKRGLYRTPWLWSLVDILSSSGNIVKARLVSSPSGGGTNRGVHNCGKCDKAVINAISNYSLYSESNVFDRLNCECKEKWLDFLDLGSYFGSTADVERLTNIQ